MDASMLEWEESLQADMVQNQKFYPSPRPNRLYGGKRPKGATATSTSCAPPTRDTNNAKAETDGEERLHELDIDMSES